MTQAEWQNFDAPASMIAWIHKQGGSARKQRLFASACCHRLCSLLPDERTRQALTIFDESIDQAVAAGQLKEASSVSWAAALNAWARGMGAAGDAARAVQSAIDESSAVCRYPESTARFVVVALRRAADQLNRKSIGAAESKTQASNLRDIFGYPSRSVELPRMVVSKTVHELSQAIYADRAFDRLPILADALEDAGWTDADILNHCRQPGDHVRGCWVVDLVLGKE